MGCGMGVTSAPLLIEVLKALSGPCAVHYRHTVVACVTYVALHAPQRLLCSQLVLVVAFGADVEAHTPKCHAAKRGALDRALCGAPRLISMHCAEAAGPVDRLQFVPVQWIWLRHLMDKFAYPHEGGSSRGR